MSLRKVSYEAFIFSVFSRNQEKTKPLTCKAVARGIRFCRTFLHMARETRAILACPCVFWLVQRAKKCDTNHIPRAYWPGGQSAPRFYNRYNLCPCARPALVGEFGPTARARTRVQLLHWISKTVQVGLSFWDLQLCQREIATTKSKKEKTIESAAI